MYGDTLTQAIKTINNYLQSGNVVYLYDGNKEEDGEVLRLDENGSLEFDLLSKINYEK